MRNTLMYVLHQVASSTIAGNSSLGIREMALRAPLSSQECEQEQIFLFHHIVKHVTPIYHILKRSSFNIPQLIVKKN